MITENKIFSSVETITPTVAAEYLKSNEKNRKTCPSTIEAYARAMRDGKWSLNGDTIVFDTDGNLINGQHRLMACIKADVPFQSLVARNVESEAFSTFDCGRHRTAGQLIGLLDDAKNSNNIASCIPIVASLKENRPLGIRMGRRKQEFPNSKVVELFNEDPQGYIEAARMMLNHYRRSRTVVSSLTTALIYYLWRVKGYDLEKVNTFFENIQNYNTSKIPTLDVLRVKLIRYTTERDVRRMPHITYNLIAKTWNAWVTGKQIKSVAWTDNMPWTQLI